MTHVRHVRPLLHGWLHGHAATPQLDRLDEHSFWTLRIPIHTEKDLGDWKVLSRSGRQRLQARFYSVRKDVEGELITDKSRFVDSEAMTISVPELPLAELQAYAAIEKLPHPNVIFTPQLMRSGCEQKDELTNFLSSYSGSSFAPYVKCALAYSLVCDFEPNLASPDSQDFSEGLSLVKEALRDPRFALREPAQELLWQAEVHRAGLFSLSIPFGREFPSMLNESLTAHRRRSLLRQPTNFKAEQHEDPLIPLMQAPLEEEPLRQMGMVLRVANEASLAPGLPVVLDVAIANRSNCGAFLEPTVSRPGQPHHTVDIFFASGSQPMSRVMHVLPAFQGCDEKPEVYPRLARLDMSRFWVLRVPMTYDFEPAKPISHSPPGEVRFQAQFYGFRSPSATGNEIDYRKRLESNMVFATIPALQGDDLHAHAAVQGLPHPQVLCNPHLMRGRAHRVNVAPLERIVETFPRSLYGLYARFALANALVWKNDKELNAPESADLERGISLAKQAWNDPRFAFQELARELYWQGEIHRAKIGSKPFLHQRHFPFDPVDSNYDSRR